MRMSAPTSTTWAHLERKPGSAYRQLFVKGKTMSARSLYDMHRDREYPTPPEEIARIFDLPVEAVREAIAYCELSPPEIQQDREHDDARIRAKLLSAFHATLSASPTGRPWAYLDRKPGSLYRQLFIKGHNVAARTLDGMYMNEDSPRTVEEIADDCNLPVDAVLEALAYCSTEPPEVQEDWEAEEARAVHERESQSGSTVMFDSRKAAPGLQLEQ